MQGMQAPQAAQLRACPNCGGTNPAYMAQCQWCHAKLETGRPGMRAFGWVLVAVGSLIFACLGALTFSELFGPVPDDLYHWALGTACLFVLPVVLLVVPGIILIVQGRHR